MANETTRLQRIREQAQILSGQKKRRGKTDGQFFTPDERFNASVEALCKVCGAKNPIEEVDLSIDSLSFYVGGSWHKILGTRLNRTARLFIENELKKFDLKRSEVHTFLFHLVPELQSAAGIFFQDRWADAEKEGRLLLISFKQAELIVVHWK